MNAFENFKLAMRGVANERDLCRAICELGLRKDERDIYGAYARHQVEDGGVWQDPMELATFLWNSREDFKDVRSFLEIGTFTGYSFFIIHTFLST